MNFIVILPFDPSPGPLEGPLGGNFNCLIFYSSSPLFDMPHDYVLENNLCDPYWPLKGDPQGMTWQSQPKSRSICYTSIITEYMCKMWHKKL